MVEMSPVVFVSKLTLLLSFINFFHQKIQITKINDKYLVLVSKLTLIYCSFFFYYKEIKDKNNN